MILRNNELIDELVAKTIKNLIWLTFVNSAQGFAWDNTGTMVSSLFPPITGTTTHSGSNPWVLATNVFALTVFNVVIPKTVLGLKNPDFLRTSHANGTVLFRGLVAIVRNAWKWCWDQNTSI